MKVLVTGGAGFIGSHLVDALVDRGASVCAYDNLYSGDKSNLAKSMDRARFLEADICDEHALADAMKGVDVVFHLAAIPSVPVSVKNPVRSNQANVDGTLKVLWAAKEGGARRVVSASSSSVYGDTPTLPKHEGMVPAPLSPYALQKWILERYSEMFHQLYGLETVALRFFNVFGPRQHPNSPYSGVIAKFSTALLRGEQPVINGDGEQSRDFSYIDNIVQLLLKAAEAPGAPGLAFNGGCGDRITVNRMVAVMNEILGTSIAPKYAEPRLGDVRDSQADLTRAREVLGYEPTVSFEEGIARTLEWYRKSMGSAPRSL